MKKERVLLITPNLNGIKDGLNREAVHLAKFLDQNIIY